MSRQKWYNVYWTDEKAIYDTIQELTLSHSHVKQMIKRLKKFDIWFMIKFWRKIPNMNSLLPIAFASNG